MNLPPYGMINVSSEEIRSSLGLINYLVIHMICVCVFEDKPVPGHFLYCPKFGLFCRCVCAGERGVALRDLAVVPEPCFSLKAADNKVALGKGEWADVRGGEPNG